MHVITRQRLQEFWHTHPDADRPLKAWLAMVRLKRYSGPPAVREDFASASFLGKWRAVFNMGAATFRQQRGPSGAAIMGQCLTSGGS
jgi:mRNA interferase HigB